MPRPRRRAVLVLLSLLFAGIALRAQIPMPSMPVPQAPSPVAPAGHQGSSAEPQAPQARELIKDLQPPKEAKESKDGKEVKDAAALAEQREDEELQNRKSSYSGPFILASDLFAARPSQALRQTGNAAVSDDYRLGTGDQMVLYVFGSATFEVPLVVDRSGQVTIPKVGAVQVAGLRLGDARKAIQNLIHGNFSTSRTELQFMKLRDVRIFIMGEVWRPGAYVIPSLTSLVNALALGGGPIPYGSYRDVRILRDGKIVQSIDLYRIRLEGVGMENLLLRDGDTLFVPTRGPQVRLDGGFVRIASQSLTSGGGGILVELKAGEKAWEAIRFMGGLQPSAYPNLLTLERIDPQGIIRTENLPMEEKVLRATTLYDRDAIRALPRVDWRPGAVEVGGRVRVPGAFEWKEGLRVSTLLKDPQQLLPDTYMGRAQIIRTRVDGSTELHPFELALALKGDPAHDIVLAPRDRVELFRITDLKTSYSVVVVGPFSRAGSYPWHERMRVSDLLFLAGLPNLNADRYYAELAQMGKDGKLSKVRKIDLQKLLYGPDSTPTGLADPEVNPLLQPLDQLSLFEIPDFKIHRTVTINGQVKRPGTYVITEEHFTLKDLVERAGGLTEEAMVKGGIFLRNAPKDAVGDPNSQGVNQVLQRLSETKVAKETSLPIVTPLLHGLNAGTLNRLVVDFEAALKGDARRNLDVLDGDQVLIPRRTGSAYVVGEVASPFANFHVMPGDKVKDLLAMAGGVTRNADTWNLRLLKADGRLVDRRVEGQEVEPGDTILVPQKFKINTTWQDTLQSLTPIALLINAFK